MNFSVTTVRFLNKELEIPKEVLNSKLVDKVREIIEDYENQVFEIGKDLDVCVGPNSNYDACLEIFKRIGVRSSEDIWFYSTYEFGWTFLGNLWESKQRNQWLREICSKYDCS